MDNFQTVLISVIAALVQNGLAIPIDNELILVTPTVQSGQTEVVCPTPGEADYLLVIDGSTSIGDENFNLLRTWLADTVESLPDTSRYALIQFSGHPVEFWKFSKYNNTEEVSLAKENEVERSNAVALRSLEYIKGTTNIGQALQFGLDHTIDEGNRPWVPDVVIVITDGQSADEPGPPADVFRARGIRVLALGITNLVNFEQLVAIAGSQRSVITIENFRELTSDTRERLLTAGECETRPIAAVVGEPTIEVQCESGYITLGADTRNPYEGVVYVKGHRWDENCLSRSDGSTNRAQIKLTFDRCDTVRRRSLSPRGVFVENTVVFSFHPNVLTKVDRAFRVSCFYMEADKTVETPIGVSAVTEELYTERVPMPTCSYSLRAAALPDAQEVHAAVNGQSVYHVWQCESDVPDAFKFRVHSCVVSDGSGLRDPVTLLDMAGCTTDLHLISPVSYAGNLFATAETHAFSFPDSANLQFECQIEICVNLEGGCDLIDTMCGPIGTAIRKRRYTKGGQQEYTDTLDVFSNSVEIFSENLISNPHYRNDSSMGEYSVENCDFDFLDISIRSFLVTLLLWSFLAPLVVFAEYCVRKNIG